MRILSGKNKFPRFHRNDIDFELHEYISKASGTEKNKKKNDILLLFVYNGPYQLE